MKCEQCKQHEATAKLYTRLGDWYFCSNECFLKHSAENVYAHLFQFTPLTKEGSEWIEVYSFMNSHTNNH